jgi:ClpP class serine protease
VPSWNDLLKELDEKKDAGTWLNERLVAALKGVSLRRQGRNVIFYASAFLQKPSAPAPTLQLTPEELNGFMSVMYGMDWHKGLVLVLHTPGGVMNAAETIVEYLWSKFTYVEVIVPTFAMSAGTMISLAANRIVMGRQSQLGPIDPQLPIGGRSVSARAVVEQFERAKTEVLGDLNTAHVWAPILQSMGPALLQEAQNALAYGEQMVARWLAERMCRSESAWDEKIDVTKAAAKIAQHFNDATTHKSHGHRIDRNEARSHGVVVEDLEDDQDLQDDVLTAYHLVSILFEKSPASKLLVSHAGRMWVKNLAVVRQKASQPK